MNDEHTSLVNKQKALKTEIQGLESSIDANQNRLITLQQSYDVCESERVTLQNKVKEAESSIFKDFSRKVGISDIFEWEHREATKSSQRAEKRQEILLLISRLRSQLELESQRSGARANTKALEKIVAKTREDLERTQSELKVNEQSLAIAEQQNIHSANELEKVKAKMQVLETKLRELSKSTHEDRDKMVVAKKALATASMALEKLRHERKSVFLRCSLEGIALPTISGDDAQKRASSNKSSRNVRQRLADGAAHNASNETNPAPDDAEANLGESRENMEVQSSEAFLIEDADSVLLSKDSRGVRSAHSGKQLKVAFDFRSLPERLRRCVQSSKRYLEVCRELEESINHTELALDRLAPSMQAAHRFSTTEEKASHVEHTLRTAREALRLAQEELRAVTEERTVRFTECFNTVNVTVGQIYKELTENTRAPGVHGTAYLTLDDTDEPYNSGTRFHATPPMKRFMGVEALSGGEKTMAALALLFALRSVQPSPFLILDEVDAALDAANVSRLGEYLRNHSKSCQCIVVSLKDELYRNADSLVGVYKDHDRHSSGILTLDLQTFAES